MLAQYSRSPMVKNYLYRLAERQKAIDTDKVVVLVPTKKMNSTHIYFWSRISSFL